MLFEGVVEANKRLFAEGNEPTAHAILVKDGEPQAVIGLVFIDSFTKQLTFNLAIPQIIRMHAPETCIFVLPSKMKRLDPDTGGIVEEEDVVMVHEVDAIKIRTVMIRRKNGETEIIEPDEKNIQVNLLEPVREAMKSVWGNLI